MLCINELSSWKNLDNDGFAENLMGIYLWNILNVTYISVQFNTVP